MLFLFVFVSHGAFHVESYLVICSQCMFVSHFSIVIISLGEERAGPFASRTCVCLVCTC